VAEERTDDPTEPASPRKREESRERGQVARSQDLAAAVILLVALLALEAYGATLMASLIDGTRRVFETMGELDLDREGIGPQVLAVGWLLARMLLPVLLVIAAAALAIHLMMVGFLFVTDPLAPDPSRIDPIAGLQRLFSFRSASRLLFGFAKILVVSVVVWLTLSGQTTNLLVLSEMEVGGIARYLIETAYVLSMRIVLALLVLALLDYAYQRWQHERDIRMTRQEVREELRRMEGDPKIRERRRQIQRQLAMQRMMAAVPKAAVVITNPTELAIALQYEEGMPAPKVVAKGADLVAERIRAIALEHGIPLVERRPLAQALFRAVEVGQQIPVDHYEAVAEVLAYVFSLGRSQAGVLQNQAGRDTRA